LRQQLTVDLARETGPVFHGAIGALYGLSEDGVPGADLLAPLHVKTIAQKPPGGLQHPTGDAEKVAPEFISAGGEWIFVYLQDIYPDWPYKDEGIASYVTKVKSIVSYLADDPYYVLVPFNEPDWIWYDLKTADPVQYIINRDRFLADWTTAYLAIRSLNPDAFIAGPNEAYYDGRFMPDFLSYAKAGQVLPDIVSWHELSPGSLRTYRSSYASLSSSSAFLRGRSASMNTATGATSPTPGSWSSGLPCSKTPRCTPTRPTGISQETTRTTPCRTPCRTGLGGCCAGMAR
jgi:hypothetical protein